jgi:glycerol-3-phosphate dehydrogenase
MVPRTRDGRVLFAIPWHGRVVVGTTDTPVDAVLSEPVPREEEIAYLLSHAARYLARDPSREDVLSTFAGIRPLVAGANAVSTAALSREHRVGVSRSGLVTIAGGKWTTYRKMAEDAVDQAARVAGLEERPSLSRDLRLHGYHEEAGRFGELGSYGSDAPALEHLIRENPGFEKRLHPGLSSRAGEVVWAVRNEMALTVEDVLARRTRILQLDARAAMEAAPAVAKLMAKTLPRDAAWEREQVERFLGLARKYLPS